MSVNLARHHGGRVTRSRRQYSTMADINITNLVDVILVLLIIFMISAPLLQSGIEVELPKSAAATLDTQQEGIVLTIDAKGGLYVNDVWTRSANLEKQMKAEMARKNSQSVFLRADSAARYGVVVDAISRLRAAGITDIGLLTKPIEKGKRASR